MRLHTQGMVRSVGLMSEINITGAEPGSMSLWLGSGT